MQVLGPGIVEQTLLRVELRQFQHAIQAGLELGNFLVHRDAFDGKALGGVCITHALKARDSLLGITETGVKITNSIVDGEILGIVLQDLLVFGDGVLQLALLDKLLRSAENFLFVEPETERHRIADSS